MLKKTISFIIAALLMAAIAAAPAGVVSEAADGTLAGRTVILDAGHGLGSSNVYEGYDEQVAMLKLALKIKPLLESSGAKVLLTRPDEKNVSVYARTAKINIWALQAVKAARPGEAGEIDRLIKIMQSIIDDPETNAAIYMNYPFDYEYQRKIHPDLKKVFEYEGHAAVRDNFLMVSLHSNATGTPINTSVNGANAFYMANSHECIANYYTGYSYEKQNKNIAHKILDNLAKIGINKRGAEDACYVMVREHNIPAVLVENGFHTNAADRAKLLDDKFLDKLAAAYADAILDYFSEIEPEKTPESPPMTHPQTLQPPAVHTPESSRPIPQLNLSNTKNIKVSLNGHSVKLTQPPIFFEGELYIGLEDIARVSGYALSETGILYRGKSYELKNPVKNGGKLYIGAAELLSIQKSVLWAEVKIDVGNARVKFRINKAYEPKWDNAKPAFENGVLCVPLGPVLRILGYRAEHADGLLTIYRNDEALYSTKTDYVFLGDTLCMTAGQLNALGEILWASFDFELVY